MCGVHLPTLPTLQIFILFLLLLFLSSLFLIMLERPAAWQHCRSLIPALRATRSASIVAAKLTLLHSIYALCDVPLIKQPL